MWLNFIVIKNKYIEIEFNDMSVILKSKSYFN